jgi:hypothetical protein
MLKRHALPFIVLAATLLATTSGLQAQVIKRAPAGQSDKKTDAKKESGKKAGAEAAASDDDDILVDDDDEVSGTAEKGTALTLGLVDLSALGDADGALAKQVARAIGKELNEGKVVIRGLAIQSDTAGDIKGTDAPSAAARKNLAAAEKQLARGKKSLKRLRFGRAVKALKAAADLFLKVPEALDGKKVKGLGDAYLGLAEAAARQGDDEGSGTWLRAFAALNPERTLDPENYPPAFVSALDGARKKTLGEKGSTIEIDATALGAAVFWNGREVGIAPLRIENVPPGKSLIRVAKKGVGLFGKTVDLAPGSSEKLSPGFIKEAGDSALEQLAKNKFNKKAAKEIGAAAAAAGLSGALVGVIAKTRTTVPARFVLVDAKTKKMHVLPAIEFDGDLLNLAIEVLKVSENAQAVFAKGKFDNKPADKLLDGVPDASEVEAKVVPLRFSAPEKAVSRSGRGGRQLASSGSKKGSDADRNLLSGGGKSGRASLMDEEKDPYEDPVREEKKPELLDEDVPLTQQAWFWPTVIGGGVAGGVALLGGLGAGGIAMGIFPNPFPRSGVSVSVDLPQE